MVLRKSSRQEGSAPKGRNWARVVIEEPIHHRNQVATHLCTADGVLRMLFWTGVAAKGQTAWDSHFLAVWSTGEYLRHFTVGKSIGSTLYRAAKRRFQHDLVPLAEYREALIAERVQADKPVNPDDLP